MSFFVDTNLLHAFAGDVDSAAAAVKRNQMAADISFGGSGLVGSSTAWALQLVSGNVHGRIQGFADDLDAASEALHGTARDYKVTDEAIAQTFPKLFSEK